MVATDDGAGPPDRSAPLRRRDRGPDAAATSRGARQPAIAAIWHFSFHVADLDRSVAFYRDVLGMHLVHEQVQDNDYTCALVGYPDARLRVAQLAMPDRHDQVSTHDLELIEYVRPRGTRQDPARHHPGAAHLAFAVPDIVAEHQRLEQVGVRFVSSPNRITAGANEGGAACYFLDPDDITLELVQPPPHRIPRHWQLDQCHDQ